MLQAEPAEAKPATRVMRKTLSRKSPFLPEVLPSLIKHEDITYTHENGQPVLLGEGSFGQACHIFLTPSMVTSGSSRSCFHSQSRLP